MAQAFSWRVDAPSLLPMTPPENKSPRPVALAGGGDRDSGDAQSVARVETPSQPALGPSEGRSVAQPLNRPWPAMTPQQQEQTRTVLQERLAAYVSRGRPRVVVTDNLHTMVSIKRGDGVVTFRVHHMFLHAPPVVLRALGRYADRQDRESARMLREFIDTKDTLVRQRANDRPLPCDVEGKYHNLQEIFDELNAKYFGGSIRARITWGTRSRRKRSRGSIKLGSYTVEDELIRIHPVLDAADVPRFFIAWIVYHEMLHEVHDMPVVDGRRIYHTPEFRKAEAQFEEYAEAVLWERVHVHKLLTR